MKIMNLDGLNKHMKKVMDERNRQGIPEFEGYSPDEMNTILYFLFEDNCPMKIRKIDSSLFSSIPIFNSVKFLLNYLHEKNEVKLTAKGFIPTKLVAEIYAQKYYLDSHIELGITKLYKETDSNYIHLTRILTEITGAAKKIKGKLSLTATGKKLLTDDQALLETILKTYCNRFNWAYFDAYESENIGKLGCGFSLILFNNYGDTVKEDSFYGSKYFAAFPLLKEGIVPTYGTLEYYVNNCYQHRMISQFAFLTGIMESLNNQNYKERLKIQKTTLFDQLFEVIPPQR